MKKKNPLSKFTDEQLYAELNRRNVDKKALEYKNLNLSGFTPKDLVCMQGCRFDWEETLRGYEDEYGPHYYFYIKIDGKLFDIYYKNCVTDNPDGERNEWHECKPSKWPEDDEHGYNGATSLVPHGFAESSENCYEYHGKGNVKAHLKKCGITDFRVWNPELFDEQTGRDANYDAD